MPDSEIKLLRDELAQVIAENRRHRNVEEEMSNNLIDLTLKGDQLTLERDQANARVDMLMHILGEMAGDKATLERMLKFYDNLHSPSSSKTATRFFSQMRVIANDCSHADLRHAALASPHWLSALHNCLRTGVYKGDTLPNNQSNESEARIPVCLCKIRI